MNVHKLGASFVRLVEHERLQLEVVSPSLFVDRITSSMKLACDQPTLYRIRQHTHDMIKIAERNWLTTGRVPQAITGAAAWIAARALQFTPSMDDLALYLHITTRTITSRVKELHEALHRIAEVRIYHHSSLFLLLLYHHA